MVQETKKSKVNGPYLATFFFWVIPRQESRRQRKSRKGKGRGKKKGDRENLTCPFNACCRLMRAHAVLQLILEGNTRDSISSYEPHPSILWPCTCSFWCERWRTLVLLEFCFLPKLVFPCIPSNCSQRQFVHIVLVWKALGSHPCETQRGGGHRSTQRQGESLGVWCSSHLIRTLEEVCESW